MSPLKSNSDSYWVYLRVLPSCIWLLITAFLWSTANIILDQYHLQCPDEKMFGYIDWALRLLVAPFIYSAMMVTLRRAESEGRPGGIIDFLRNGFENYIPFALVNILTIVAVIVLGIVTFLVHQSQGWNLPEGGDWMYVISVPLVAVRIVWFTVINMESGKVWKSFLRSVRIICTNFPSLILAGLWGGIVVVHWYLSKVLTPEQLETTSLLRSAVDTVATLVVLALIMAIYKDLRVRVFGETSDSVLPPDLPGVVMGEGDKLAGKAYKMMLMAIIPPLSIFAVWLGYRAFKKKTGLVIKSFMACLVGSFFTLFYIFILLGFFLPKSAVPEAPGYNFLSEEDNEMATVAAFMQAGDFAAADSALRQAKVNKDNPGWVYTCASGLNKWMVGDINGALSDLRDVSKQKPESGAFYYYYGLLLWQQNTVLEAGENFKLALQKNPDLAAADYYLQLINNTYDIPKPLFYGGYVLILVILLTLHEYGHAYAAWKLGDSTAKDQGRITMNPLAHIDLFGSLILPGILIFQQSDIVFGWAKPVPVNRENLRNPEKDDMIVSFAGPGMNLVVAMASYLVMLLILLMVRIFCPGAVSHNMSVPFSVMSLAGTPFNKEILMAVMFFKQMCYTSLILGAFNLIPIPPLDGSWILSGILKGRAKVIFEKIRPHGFIIFIVLVLTSVFDYILSVPMFIIWAIMAASLGAMGYF